MQVIAVRGVVIGRQDGREYAARTIPHFAQESSFGAGAFPVLQDRYLLAAL